MPGGGGAPRSPRRRRTRSPRAHRGGSAAASHHGAARRLCGTLIMCIDDAVRHAHHHLCGTRHPQRIHRAARTSSMPTPSRRTASRGARRAAHRITASPHHRIAASPHRKARVAHTRGSAEQCGTPPASRLPASVDREGGPQPRCGASRSESSRPPLSTEPTRARPAPVPSRACTSWSDACL